MTDPVATAFRSGVEAMDMSAVIPLLAEDVVFKSPVVFAEYVGREAVAPILHGVAMTFEDFRYTAEYASDDGHVLAFAARVGDRTLEGVDILRIVDAQITEFTVMIRPYSAATLLRERMAALLTG
jgi:hypothetical protein